LDRLQWCISSPYNSPLHHNFNWFIMGVITVVTVQEVILKVKVHLESTQLPPLDRLLWCKAVFPFSLYGPAHKTWEEPRTTPICLVHGWTHMKTTPIYCPFRSLSKQELCGNKSHLQHHAQKNIKCQYTLSFPEIDYYGYIAHHKINNKVLHEEQECKLIVICPLRTHLQDLGFNPFIHVPRCPLPRVWVAFNIFVARWHCWYLQVLQVPLEVSIIIGLLGGCPSSTPWFGFPKLELFRWIW
jgi:hypothetical protein